MNSTHALDASLGRDTTYCGIFVDRSPWLQVGEESEATCRRCRERIEKLEAEEKERVA